MAESAIRECQLAYQKVLSQIKSGCTLVAVSKTKPAFLIKGIYLDVFSNLFLLFHRYYLCFILGLFDIGHLHFGENYVQELIAKAQLLPADVFISNLCSSYLD